MKMIFALLWLVSFNSILAQNINNTNPFSSFDYGAYTGINFESISEIGGTFFIELNTNLISDLKLKFSLGYARSYMHTSYTVQTYSEIKIDTTVFYNAEEYEVNKNEYDVFPISIGLQYMFNFLTISPYIFSEFSYNFIDTKVIRSPGYSLTYNSFEELPDEFREKHYESFPNNSFSIAFGLGVVYPVTTKLNLDMRYFYKIDNKILNTHHIVVGILI